MKFSRITTILTNPVDFQVVDIDAWITLKDKTLEPLKNRLEVI